jgi:drug/metabolite transporter (DMT)-like permease
MAMLARLLSRSIPGPEIAIVRFALGIAAVLGACLFLRVGLRPRRWRWLVARGIFGGTAALLYFICIARIGVAMATLLNYTGPVWSMVFAWLFLREHPGRHALVALGMTIVGVALVTGVGADTWHLGAWQAVAVLSGLVAGLAVTSVRATRRELADGTPSESSWTVFAAFTIFGFIATLPLTTPPLGTWIVPSSRQWALLLLCGGLGVLAQLLMTKALRQLTTVRLGITQQMTVVLAVIGGIAFFGESFTVRAAIGSVITVAGVLWSVVGGASRA